MTLTLVAALIGTIELTPDNFDKEVFESGKSAFVKFLAPW
jgi:protein disulfide-isomerase A6